MFCSMHAEFRVTEMLVTLHSYPIFLGIYIVVGTQDMFPIHQVPQAYFNHHVL
ncbi:hypothetical protein BDV29DRAFT_168431 [Aspergillus leporis]|uniref:Uncharacterized protein n=1 Tax=Aspergillus leporis TaxID=41062 RepID=A0A5N5X972_9EURO|nr:hypothetical protein BDV29DRAFT_168431 [Aspergillus leporis]